MVMDGVSRVQFLWQCGRRADFAPGLCAESAGLRVHALSSPLAESGISILFLSTYQADFILVKESALTSVTAILESRGFRFNAVDDSDEEEAALNESIASLGGLSRRESLRRQGGGGGSPTKTRPRSNGGSLAGSLTLSDRGSVGGSSNKSSTPSATMSRSASTGRAVAAAVAAAARPGASRQSTLATIDGELNSTSPLDPETTFVTSPTSYPAALPLPPTPRPPPPAFSPVTSLTLLPDELVCVGLAQGEPSETLWRTKIVTALFYPERVLPRPEAMAGKVPTGRQRHEEWEGNSSTPTGSSSHLFPPRPKPRPPPPDHLAGSLPTALTPAPVPFVALTQTADGTSLTADVRLLRALFGEEGSQEEELVYAVGDGGLKGVWAGEEGEGEGEEALPPSEEEDGEEEELLMEGVGVPLPAPFRRTDSGSSAASRSRGRSRGPPVPAGDNLEEEVSEAEEWELLQKEDAEREQRDRREKARRAGEGGRRLLKCLQLDLVAFGLGKLLSPVLLSLSRR